ncbi:MAG: type II toxin-antitoxin system Phd/YefM family antitoxin [Oscillospiraceae bacterium]|nr:type II toxin-antitoxin system Phd/YefM family antitoxin [Oscillospiraceae bacterium]
MPTIRSSTDLRNHYNEISALCHETGEPVYITKNGKGDLVMISMEKYDELFGRFELFRWIQDGINDVKYGNTLPLEEAMKEIRDNRNVSVETGN